MPDVAQAVVPFIWEQLERRRSCDGDKAPRPVLVGLQGPQGCGKTTMSARIKETLAASDPPVHVEVISLDDLYLPKAELDAIAMAHTTNALLQGRGQPGTHDTVLGSHIFAKLLAMRGSDAAPVQVPVFDKSCHQGQGDRLPEPRVVGPPVDVVLFEGWCVGFECLCENVLSEKYAEALASPEPYACKQHPIASLRTINRNLRAWKDQWYPLFDAMIQIMPKVSSGKPWDLVYPWRLEAEHKMKAANGGRGMTDEQVMQFVQRYMPSYELFCNDFQQKTLWPERTLCIDLDASRQVVGVRRA